MIGMIKQFSLSTAVFAVAMLFGIGGCGQESSSGSQAGAPEGAEESTGFIDDQAIEAAQQAAEEVQQRAAEQAAEIQDAIETQAAETQEAADQAVEEANEQTQQMMQKASDQASQAAENASKAVKTP